MVWLLYGKWKTINYKDYWYDYCMVNEKQLITRIIDMIIVW